MRSGARRAGCQVAGEVRSWVKLIQKEQAGPGRGFRRVSDTHRVQFRRQGPVTTKKKLVRLATCHVALRLWSPINVSLCRPDFRSHSRCHTVVSGCPAHTPSTATFSLT